MTDSVPHMALLHRVLISHVRTLDTIFFKLAGSECIISSNSANLTEKGELSTVFDNYCHLLSL